MTEAEIEKLQLEEIVALSNKKKYQETRCNKRKPKETEETRRSNKTPEETIINKKTETRVNKS